MNNIDTTSWLGILGAAWLAAVPCTAPAAHAAAGFKGEPLVLESSDRLLVLAPHPDDEVLGSGGIIQEAVSNGIPIRVVFLTYGDNNELSFAVYRRHPVLEKSAVRRMGLLRHDEAVASCATLGLAATNIVFLGYPDFGTLAIWNEHWSHRPAYESLLPRASAVPYTNAYHAGSPHKGESVVRDIEEIARDFRPTKVFVSHPADYNTDQRKNLPGRCPA